MKPFLPIAPVGIAVFALVRITAIGSEADKPQADPEPDQTQVDPLAEYDRVENKDHPGYIARVYKWTQDIARFDAGLRTLAEKASVPKEEDFKKRLESESGDLEIITDGYGGVVDFNAAKGTVQYEVNEKFANHSIDWEFELASDTKIYHNKSTKLSPKIARIANDGEGKSDYFRFWIRIDESEDGPFKAGDRVRLQASIDDFSRFRKGYHSGATGVVAIYYLEEGSNPFFELKLDEAEVTLIKGADQGEGKNESAEPEETSEEGAETANEGLEALQGEWRSISATTDGKVEPDGDQLVMTVKGDRCTMGIIMENFGVHPLSEQRVRIDSSRNPKTIDSFHTNGTLDALGIYEIKGDTLTIASMSADGDSEDRPETFESTPGSKISTLKFRRKDAGAANDGEMHPSIEALKRCIVAIEADDEEGIQRFILPEELKALEKAFDRDGARGNLLDGLVEATNREGATPEYVGGTHRGEITIAHGAIPFPVRRNGDTWVLDIPTLSKNLQAAQAAARQAEARADARQIVKACLSYAADHGGKFPPSLGALVPDYLGPNSASIFYENPAEQNGARWEYRDGLKTTDDAREEFLKSTKLYSGTRIVARVDGSVHAVKENAEVDKAAKHPQDRDDQAAATRPAERRGEGAEDQKIANRQTPSKTVSGKLNDARFVAERIELKVA